MHPTAKGDLSEIMITARFLRRGEIVLNPIGQNHRYDLVLDRKGTFLRVQCKTGKINRSGAIVFNTSSNSQFVSKGKNIGYHGQVDFFGVYCADNDKCYLIPIEMVGSGKSYLRLAPPKNNQKSKINLASDFEI